MPTHTIPMVWPTGFAVAQPGTHSPEGLSTAGTGSGMLIDECAAESARLATDEPAATVRERSSWPAPQECIPMIAAAISRVARPSPTRPPGERRADASAVRTSAVMVPS